MPRRQADHRASLHARDFHVLLVLAGGALHGYAIVREVDQQSEGRLKLDPANLYRALAQLQEDGLIEEVDPSDRPNDARRRRYYSLTKTGSHTLQTEVERMRELTALADSRMRRERHS